MGGGEVMGGMRISNGIRDRRRKGATNQARFLALPIKNMYILLQIWWEGFLSEDVPSPTKSTFLLLPR